MIKVISWNISWGSMSNDESSAKDITAKKLAYDKCFLDKYKKNTCLENVANYLSRIEYDFIGL